MHDNYNDMNVIFQAWNNAVYGTLGFSSAKDLAERWLNKGGNINLIVRRFINRESIFFTIGVRNPAGSLSRQFRLLLSILYLGGKYTCTAYSKHRSLQMFVRLYTPGSCIVCQNDTINYESLVKAFIYFRRRKNIFNLIQIFRCYQNTRRLALQLHNLYVLPLFDDKPNSKYF